MWFLFLKLSMVLRLVHALLRLRRVAFSVARVHMLYRLRRFAIFVVFEGASRVHLFFCVSVFRGCTALFFCGFVVGDDVLFQQFQCLLSSFCSCTLCVRQYFGVQLYCSVALRLCVTF